MDLQQKTDYIQAKLKSLGERNVYFEPPADYRMLYPCSVFRRGTISTRNADNNIYKMNDAYDITHISRTPDDEMVHRILVGDEEHPQPFKMIRHVRHFVSDGLHHDTFKLYL